MEKTEAVQKLVAEYTRYFEEKETSQKHTGEKIHVDEIAAKVAAFYEKVRNLIAYSEEHLLRKSTIERILRRRIFLKDFKKNFAEPLIKELIRSGHLANDTVPESKITDVQKIIDDILFLLERGVFKDESEKEDVSDWLIAISVSAIEEELFPPAKERMLSEAMIHVIQNSLEMRNAELSDEWKNIQLFIAVQRALFRPDFDQLQYRLLKFLYPHWGTLSSEEAANAAKNLPELKRNLHSLLKNPIGRYFFKLCNREKIVFLLLGDLVFSGSAIDENFEGLLKHAYHDRYKREKIQLRKLAFFSVISFFISKILVALAIEIPIDTYFAHAFSIRTIIINITLPPLLMILILLFIRLPSKQNYYLVAGEVRNVVFSGGQKKYIVTIPKRRSWISEALVRLAYLITLGVVLYFLTTGLMWLDFSVASIVIFALFTSMVIATGVKINNRAKEISLLKEKVTFMSFLVDLVAIPFMTIGKWAINGLSKFNVLVIVFNFLIELPFQLFVEFLENFRGFIKAKKEEED